MFLQRYFRSAGLMQDHDQASQRSIHAIRDRMAGKLEVNVVSRKPGNGPISWVYETFTNYFMGGMARHVALEYFSVGCSVGLE